MAPGIARQFAAQNPGVGIHCCICVEKKMKKKVKHASSIPE